MNVEDRYFWDNFFEDESKTFANYCVLFREIIAAFM